MRDLNYQLKQRCARNRDGSYSTQANRQGILDLIARLSIHDELVRVTVEVIDELLHTATGKAH